MAYIQEQLITIYDGDDQKNLDTGQYNTQGLGALPDFTSALVTSKLNGTDLFTGVYPSNGVNAHLIKNDRIIQTYVDENRPKQRMRIYNVNTDIVNNTIEIEAEPIFNDIRRYVGDKVDTNGVAISATEAFNRAKKIAKPAIPERFKFVSTSSTQAVVTIEKFNMLEFFGGKEGSILDRFKGEFIRDNNTLNHTDRLGKPHNVKAIYTKNLNGLNLEIDSQSVLIGVFPYISEGGEDEPEIILPEQVILTEDHEKYPNGMISFVDFKDKATDVDTLRTQAVNWLNLNKAKQKPQVSGTVELVTLRKKVGYDNFSSLETVSLGDGVDVYHPELNTNMEARIVEFEYNVLTDSYEKFTIGELKSNFLENAESNTSDLINDAINQITKGNDIGQWINDVVENQTDMITGQVGGNVVLDPKEKPERILIMDSPDKNKARDVIQINNAGIGFSRTGINGTYETAWTIDGVFNAKFITAGVLKSIQIEGVNIKGSTLISESGNSRISINNGAITTEINNKKWAVLNGSRLEFYQSDGSKVLGGFYRTRYEANGREYLNLTAQPGTNIYLGRFNPSSNAHEGSIEVNGDNGNITFSTHMYMKADMDVGSWAFIDAWFKTKFTIPNNVNVQFYSDVNMNGFRILNQSDIRLKENIEPSKVDAINETKKLEFYEFDRKQNYKDKTPNAQPQPERELGLIAQYVPFLAKQDNNSHYLSIDTNKQIMLNSMTNKALIERIEELEAKITKLETKPKLNRRKYHHNR